MFFFLFILSVYSNFLVRVVPEDLCLIDFQLNEEHSDLVVTVSAPDAESQIKYKMFKNSYETEFDKDDFDLLTKKVSLKYDEHGLYTLVLYNYGSKECLINVQSKTTKIMGNEDKDVKALKSLFNEIEERLNGGYDLYLRLKSIQDKNIAETKRINRGLFILLFIPIIYIVVGFVKVNAVKMMFSPKRGIKP